MYLWADLQHGYIVEMPFEVKKVVWIDMQGNKHIEKNDGNKVECDADLGIYDCFVCKIS